MIEAGTIDSETMTLDGVALAPSLAEPRIDTRLLPDGPHELDVRVADMSGNVGTLALPCVFNVQAFDAAGNGSRTVTVRLPSR